MTYGIQQNDRETYVEHRLKDYSCPLCGCRVGYRGFSHIECVVDSTCPNYREQPPQPVPENFFKTFDIAWARGWLAKGGQVEYTFRDAAGSWHKISDSGVLRFIQGGWTDEAMNNNFDFRVA